MKRCLLFLLPLIALSSCEYGLYCKVRNSIADPILVTVVLEAKETNRGSGEPNPGLKGFKRAGASSVKQGKKGPIRTAYYTYTVTQGNEIELSSATRNAAIMEVYVTRGSDTLSRVKREQYPYYNDLFLIEVKKKRQ